MKRGVPSTSQRAAIALMTALSIMALGSAPNGWAQASGSTNGSVTDQSDESNGEASGDSSGDQQVPQAVIPLPSEPVLQPLDDAAPLPDPARLQAQLAAAIDGPALGPAVAVQISDAVTGQSLLSRSADRTAVPASAAKILTAAAVLSLRGTESRLSTRVVSAADGEIALIGGGDQLLAAGRGNPDAINGRAGLADLAEATAQALRESGQTSITLTLDDTLFAGGGVNPAWASGDVGGGFVAPVRSLAIDSGNAAAARPAPGLPFARVNDPALSAASVFAKHLGQEGITVRGKIERRAEPAPRQADVLAEVHSARLADVVEFALGESDNTVAEALALLAAVSGNYPSSFAGGGAAVLDRLALIGVDTTDEVMPGGSGLGTGYQVSAATLVQTMLLAAGPDHPHLRPVLSGLPVAGASGTLVERFGADAAASARGVVRAKTGTLTGASSLAGTVVDADGRLLVFAVLADQVASTDAARSALDASAAVVAGCGCR